MTTIKPQVKDAMDNIIQQYWERTQDEFFENCRDYTFNSKDAFVEYLQSQTYYSFIVVKKNGNIQESIDECYHYYLNTVN